MAFNELFKVYPNRNSELRSVAKLMYEFGKTVAAENSAAHTYGLDEHTVNRQRKYIEKAKSVVNAIASRPLPDRQGAAKVQLPIDLTEAYETFTTDVAGNAVPLNEATQLLQEQWMLCAAELASSNSASLVGSLVAEDGLRALNNIAVIEKLLEEMAIDIKSEGADGFLDLPATAEPNSEFKVRSGGTTTTR
ncbi:MAG: hypothetical protein H6961_07035 [Chromatiaceae bacterium]|nr:hypothetical protein [Chromatiaceae bacterium]